MSLARQALNELAAMYKYDQELKSQRLIESDNREWESAETAKQHYRKEISKLEEREFSLQDKISSSGYAVDKLAQTKSGEALLNASLDELKGTASDYRSNIENLISLQSDITSAVEQGKQWEKEFGAAIKAGEDELWKNYMLEDKEIGIAMKTLSDEDQEKYKSANMQRALRQGLTTLKDAKILSDSDISMKATAKQIEAAEFSLAQGKLESARGTLDYAEKQNTGMITQLGLHAQSNFNMGGLSLHDMQTLDADDLNDAWEDFYKRYPSMIDEAKAFISGVTGATAAGINPAMFVVQFQSAAYSDFLQLEELENKLEIAAEENGKTLKEYIANLPSKDPTKKELKRLKNKTAGYLELGLYKGGKDLLDKSFQMIQMRNEIKTKQLTLDVTSANEIQAEGFSLDLDHYSPDSFEHLSEGQIRDIEISLAALSSMGPKQRVKIADDDLKLIVGELSDKLSALESLGFTDFKEYDILKKELRTRSFTYNSIINQSKIEAASAKLDEMLEKAAEATGISVELLEKQWRKKAMQQTPWSSQRKTSSGRMY